MQRECLKPNFKDSKVLKAHRVYKACKLWRKCLRQGSGDNHLEHISDILEAANVDVHAHDDLNSPQCIYPPKEDPETWDCNCHDEMIARCHSLEHAGHSFSIQTCFRAQFCVNPRVCSNWKKLSCETSEIEVLMTALQDLTTPAPALAELGSASTENSSDMQQERSLLARQRLTDRSAATGVDGSTFKKACN